MSAPNTDIEKQQRRHRGPLAGMWLAVAVAVVLFIGWLVWMFALADPGPQAPERPAVPSSAQIEPSTPATTVTPDAQNTAPSTQ